VVDSKEHSVPGAEVVLVGWQYQQTTNEAGEVTFRELPAGRYLVHASLVSGEMASEELSLAGGETRTLTLKLHRARFHEEVVVSAAHPERLAATARPVSALSGDALLLANPTSLGEALSGQPGVHSTFYAPGANRPILRGQGGDRIRILQSGLEVGDVSDTSPDHGVALLPQLFERVEVLRGPAALLYGSDTLGGVINAVGNLVPEEQSSTPLAGFVTASYSSNAKAGRLTSRVEGGLGTWGWRVWGSKGKSDDYASARGDVSNSFTRTDGGGLGVSYFAAKGFFGLSLDQHESRYGTPVDERVQVDLWRRRLDFRGELNPGFRWLKRLRAAAALSDYHHREVHQGHHEEEDHGEEVHEEVGTRVDNQLNTARIEAHFTFTPHSSGILGVESSWRDLSSTGPESYLPRVKTAKQAVFFWQHGDLGRWHWELAGRWDQSRHTPASGAPTRSFNFASLTASITTDLQEDLRVYFALGRTGKAPNPEELYSDGPHAATGLYEVGNPSLGTERNLHSELGLKWRLANTHFQMNLFRSQVANFTFQTLTGERRGEFPVALYVQREADFWGAEVLWHWDLLQGPHHQVELALVLDWVRGKLAEGGNLPRVPPGRLSAQINWHTPQFSLLLSSQKVLPATHTAVEESRTPGYTLWELALGYRFFSRSQASNLWLKGSNLTDVLALNHAAFFKERSPLPGRSVHLIYQLVF
ncbi:MAG: TonB-dependent receptor, partial [Thermoanaerobaculum sp.]|nr:TonB-dependent receptor [Thermoanaerobaculum sp.]